MAWEIGHPSWITFLSSAPTVRLQKCRSDHRLRQVVASCAPSAFLSVFRSVDRTFTRRFSWTLQYGPATAGMCQANCRVGLATGPRANEGNSQAPYQCQVAIPIKVRIPQICPKLSVYPLMTARSVDSPDGHLPMEWPKTASRLVAWARGAFTPTFTSDPLLVSRPCRLTSSSRWKPISTGCGRKLVPRKTSQNPFGVWQGSCCRRKDESLS